MRRCCSGSRAAKQGSSPHLVNFSGARWFFSKKSRSFLTSSVLNATSLNKLVGGCPWIVSTSIGPNHFFPILRETGVRSHQSHGVLGSFGGGTECSARE